MANRGVAGMAGAGAPGAESDLAFTILWSYNMPGAILEQTRSTKSRAVPDPPRTLGCDKGTAAPMQQTFVFPTFSIGSRPFYGAQTASPGLSFFLPRWCSCPRTLFYQWFSKVFHLP